MLERVNPDVGYLKDEVFDAFSFSQPRLVYFVDELPKTVSGKIRRTELRDRLRCHKS